MKYIPSASSELTVGFVDAGLFRKITDHGLNGSRGYQQVLSSSFSLEFEIPRSWTNFQVAEYLVSVLHGKAADGLHGLGSDSIETLFDNFLKDKLSRDELSVDEALTSYKQSVANGLSELLDDIQAWTETGVSFIPGASGPMAVYEWQQGRRLFSLITLLTSGPVAGVIGEKLGAVAVKSFGKLVEVLPAGAVEQLVRHPQEKAALTKLLHKSSGGLDEQLEIVRRFFHNRVEVGKLDAVGNLTRRGTGTSIAIRETLGIVGQSEWAPHHLIAIAEAKNSQALKAAANVGYDINHKGNLMKLPNTEKLALSEKLPLHPKGGRHVDEYTRFVERQLSDLDIAWGNGKNDLGFQQLFEEIAQVEALLRSKLENLELKLTHLEPPR